MGKRIIITGATSGIGMETLKKLAEHDHEIITANRNSNKAFNVVAEIKEEFPKANIRSYMLDLSSFESIKNFSERIHSDYDHIDILFNNAGLFLSEKQKTEQGFEMTIGVNYIGTYYLTYLLEDILARGHRPQVINVNSRAALFGHLTYEEGRFFDQPRGLRAYAASKYMQLLWIYFAAEDFMEKGIRINAVHPGDVSTDLWRTKNLLIKLIWPFLKKTLVTSEEGTVAGLYLVENEGLESFGKLYQKKGELMNFKKYDKEKAKRLIDTTKKSIRELGYDI